MDDEIRFEWDPAKNAHNMARHGVSFEEAALVFIDEYALLIDDPDHSDVEDRFILLGRSLYGILVVCHCYRADAIRIISARKASARERRAYLEGLN
ncbi:MAG TPA: BrnT family toxin [Kofleriaceae bacterium]|nr:BrnT family toxin [Kofleriaceae bacterium]